MNCWAHARRYFFKALTSDPDRAKVAFDLIGMLFKIERSIATAPRKKRERIRRMHSAPVVERFFSWCDEEWPQLFEDTPIYDGVRYARNQRTGLKRFLDDGRLPLHNNVSERELRRQAVGRKNWIFVGSDDGARANAVFTSLLASCRMLKIEPWAYLRDLLCLLPDWPAHRVLELARQLGRHLRDRRGQGQTQGRSVSRRHAPRRQILSGPLATAVKDAIGRTGTYLGIGRSNNRILRATVGWVCRAHICLDVSW